MVDLRQMRYFIAVAEELHFGRAAARLHMAQPPLSRQIRLLEGAVGARLLDRSRRSVALTAAGRVFLAEARATVRQADRAVELTLRAARGETGQLAVAFIDAAIYSVIPPVVRRFSQVRPGVELSVTELRIPDQIREVAEGRLHAGFVHPPVPDPRLAVETVFTEELAVALPAGHPLAVRDRVDVAELAGTPLIQFPREINPPLFDDIVALCRAAGYTPPSLREASPKQTVIGLVAAGLGASLLPASLENLRRDGVVYRPLAGPGLTVDTSVIWRRTDRDPVLHAFLRVVREVCRAEDAGPADPVPVPDR
ncbi:LysR family transcriptional regulator [Streptomyces sp. CNQ-509]|uniref:LysR family transcriptional regulator n=1 Tax=Streptomyces sp. CNQ-509 TaxID=444103 RepID=UPI00062DF759|nr:LysR family transcriptional regulator [Streptomyces sp. CNQ-509]AKH82019.1 LysR family transcriptional regulator [Streptomyces sp. CNQ-509]